MITSKRLIVPDNRSEKRIRTALLIGVDEYQHVPSLPAAIGNDVNSLFDLLSADWSPYTNVIKLLGVETSRDGILSVISRLVSTLTEQDVFLLYFSGHGVRKGDRSYLVARDTHPDALEQTAISMDGILEIIPVLRDLSLIFITDACHQEGPFDSGFSFPIDMPVNVAGFTSSRPEEASYLMPDLPESIYTHFLLEGLNGAADREQKQQVTIFDLHRYVSRKVRDYALPRGLKQTPMLSYRGAEDIAIISYPKPQAMINDEQRRIDAAEAYHLMSSHAEAEEWEMVLEQWDQLLKLDPDTKRGLATAIDAREHLDKIFTANDSDEVEVLHTYPRIWPCERERPSIVTGALVVNPETSAGDLLLYSDHNSGIEQITCAYVAHTNAFPASSNDGRVQYYVIRERSRIDFDPPVNLLGKRSEQRTLDTELAELGEDWMQYQAWSEDIRATGLWEEIRSRIVDGQEQRAMQLLQVELRPLDNGLANPQHDPRLRESALSLIETYEHLIDSPVTGSTVPAFQALRQKLDIRPDYAIEIEDVDLPAEIVAGESVTVSIKLRNTGSETLQTDEELAIDCRWPRPLIKEGMNWHWTISVPTPVPPGDVLSLIELPAKIAPSAAIYDVVFEINFPDLLKGEKLEFTDFNTPLSNQYFLKNVAVSEQSLVSVAEEKITDGEDGVAAEDAIGAVLAKWRKVDLNSANVTELQTLPGIGQTLATRIVAYRQTVGLFDQPSDVMGVDGISLERFKVISDQVLADPLPADENVTQDTPVVTPDGPVAEEGSTRSTETPAGMSAVGSASVDGADSDVGKQPTAGQSVADTVPTVPAASSGEVFVSDADLGHQVSDDGEQPSEQSLVSVTEENIAGIEDDVVARDAIGAVLAKWRRVDLNSATEEELRRLPGIGRDLAARIVAYRQEVGPFDRPSDVVAVTGIGQAKYEAISDRVLADPLPTDENVTQDTPIVAPDGPVAEEGPTRSGQTPADLAAIGSSGVDGADADIGKQPTTGQSVADTVPIIPALSGDDVSVSDDMPADEFEATQTERIEPTSQADVDSSASDIPKPSSTSFERIVLIEAEPRPRQTIDDHTLDVHIMPRAHREPWQYQVILEMRSHDHHNIDHVESAFCWDLNGGGAGEKLGQTLFEALFHETVEHEPVSTRDAYNQFIGRAHNSQNLRIQIRINNETPELHAIKWEFLWDTVSAKRGPIACSSTMPFSRFLHVTRSPYRVRQISPKRPLRILAAVASPVDLEPDWEQPSSDLIEHLAPIRETELEMLKRSLDRVSEHLGPVVQALDRRNGNLLCSPHEMVSLELIRQRLADGYDLAPFSVLHLVCHGIIQADQTACLVLHKKNEMVSELVPEDRLADLLSQFGPTNDKDGLRLIVLASCLTAEQTDNRALKGVARQLVAKGIPAVVAMQGRLEYDAAQHFAQRLYTNLIAYGEIDRAVNAARRELYDLRPRDIYSQGTVGKNQFGVPVLFMNVPDGKLFEADEERQQGEKSLTTQATPLASISSSDAEQLVGDMLGALAGQLGPQLNLATTSLTQSLLEAMRDVRKEPEPMVLAAPTLFGRPGQESKRWALIQAAATYRRLPQRRAILLSRAVARKRIAGLIEPKAIQDLKTLLAEEAENAQEELKQFVTEFQNWVLDAGQVSIGDPDDNAEWSNIPIRHLRTRLLGFGAEDDSFVEAGKEVVITGNLTWPDHELYDEYVPSTTTLDMLLELCHGHDGCAVFNRMTGNQEGANEDVPPQIASLLLHASTPECYLPYDPALASGVLEHLALHDDTVYNHGFEGYCLLATELLHDEALGFEDLADVTYFLQCLVGGQFPIIDQESEDFPPDLSLSLNEVTLEPNRTDSELLVHDHVLEQAIAALNAGKHIILLGPPGTGKTTLAEDLCRCAFDLGCSRGHALVTATADWTTFDTIGGYVPQSDGRLAFRPGIFLDAIDTGKWLIIDEINRADIDKSFGELFTVLSGQAVTLPYTIEERQVRILPAEHPRSEQTHDYVIDPSWRIIGTMNVYDKASLFAMSLAFMRRFAFIDVTLPDPKPYQRLIEQFLRRAQLLGNGISSDVSDVLAATLYRVFDHKQGENHDVANVLMRWRSLGPAIAKDMVEYLEQRAKSLGGTAILTKKHLAEALLLYVVPQFEGLSSDNILNIYGQLCTDFPGDDGSLLLARIEELFPFVPSEKFRDRQRTIEAMPDGEQR